MSVGLCVIDYIWDTVGCIRVESLACDEKEWFDPSEKGKQHIVLMTLVVIFTKCFLLAQQLPSPYKINSFVSDGESMIF